MELKKMVVVVIRAFDFVPFLIFDFIGKAYTDRDIYVILKHIHLYRYKYIILPTCRGLEMF